MDIEHSRTAEIVAEVAAQGKGHSPITKAMMIVLCQQAMLTCIGKEELQGRKFDTLRMSFGEMVAALVGREVTVEHMAAATRVLVADLMDMRAE